MNGRISIEVVLQGERSIVSIVRDTVVARGHPNVRALHRTTFEITKDRELTERGDCIIGVSADKASADLSRDLKDCLKKPLCVLVILLAADGRRDVVIARGDPKLILEDERRIIVRRSTYIDSATIAIEANKAARDIDRKLVELLKSSETELVVELIAADLSELVMV